MVNQKSKIIENLKLILPSQVWIKICTHIAMQDELELGLMLMLNK